LPISYSKEVFTANNNFILLQKAEDFADYFFPIVDRFPKYEKFALCTEIKNDCYSLIRLIYLMNKVRDKKERLMKLEEIDSYIALIRFLIRHSYNRKYLAMNSYETAGKMIDEVGRIIGAFIKECNTN